MEELLPDFLAEHFTDSGRDRVAELALLAPVVARDRVVVREGLKTREFGHR